MLLKHEPGGRGFERSEVGGRTSAGFQSREDDADLYEQA
jgi:hypothetical protein